MAMVKFKHEREEELALLFLALWNELPNRITLKDIEEAINGEDLSFEAKTKIQDIYNKFAKAFIYPMLIDLVNRNSVSLSSELDIDNIVLAKDEIKKWSDIKTKMLASYYANTQISSIEEAIRLTQGLDDRSRAYLIHSIIGLDEYRTKNTINYYNKLSENIQSNSRKRELTDKYTNDGREKRAENSGISEFNWNSTAAKLFVAQAIERYGKEMIMTKTWITKGDSRVCPHCRQVSGMTIPLDMLFPIYGGIMSPADSHNRCRCKLKIKRVNEKKLTNTKNSDKVENINDKGYNNSNKRKNSKEKFKTEEYGEYLQEKLNVIDELTGEKYFIPVQTTFESTRIIAKGKNIHIVDHLVNEFGGEKGNWKKRVGKIESDRYMYDIHWFELGGKQYITKVKVRREKK